VTLVTALPLAVTVGVVWGTATSEPAALWMGLGGFALAALLYLPCVWWWKRDHPDAAVAVTEVDFGPGVDPASLLERRRSQDLVSVVVT
jgi:hypothetical protein